MADQVLPSSTVSPAHRLGRKLAPFLAFALLMGLGLALRASETARETMRQALTDLVRQGYSAGDAAHLAEAIAAGAGVLALVIGQSLIVILALLAIEAALAGPPRRWRTVGFALGVQALTALFYFLAGPLLGRLLPWDVGLGPFLIIRESALPELLHPVVPLLGGVLLILFATFGGYWSHRAQHRFAILWRFHAVHHSVEHMDAANSYVHPFDVLGERIALIALGVVFRIDLDTFIWLSAFTAFADRLIHSRCPIHFGVLGHVLVDNRHHFIHHSLDPRHYDRNFSGYLSLWDRLFGTYYHPESDELLPTGLTDRKPPADVWQFATARLEPRQPA